MIYYIKDNLGHRWKVRQAISVKAACNAIASARVMGSIGSKDTLSTRYVDGKPDRVLADVVRVHSDYTEQKAYETLR